MTYSWPSPAATAQEKRNPAFTRNILKGDDTMEWEKLLNTERIKYIDSQCGANKRIPDKRPDTDLRAEFERDYDRIIFSTPLRRLHDKTQVFPLEPNDSVRSRLIHSMEVSCVARGMAKGIFDKKDETKAVSRDIQTIAATCGLLHDFGNPPFGHSGEEAIRDWFVTHHADAFLNVKDEYKNDFLKFEGNAQTFRLLTKLQVLNDEYGLNLTCGTLSASLKYIADANGIDKKIHGRSKCGFFQSDKDRVKIVQEKTCTVGMRNPITLIVEAADDCVYNIIDIEDGYKKKLLTYQQLKDTFNGNEMGEICLRKADEQAEQTSLKLDPAQKEDGKVQFFRVQAIGQITSAVTRYFTENYEKIMRGEYTGELVVDSAAGNFIEACRKLNREVVYCSSETLKLELMGKHIICDLMNVFWDGIKRCDEKHITRKAFDLISKNYITIFNFDGENKPVAKLHLLTDYICGMTDSFAMNLHKKLFNG